MENLSRSSLAPTSQNLRFYGKKTLASIARPGETPWESVYNTKKKEKNKQAGHTYGIDFIDTRRENNAAGRSVLGNARVIVFQYESHG